MRSNVDATLLSLESEDNALRKGVLKSFSKGDMAESCRTRRCCRLKFQSRATGRKGLNKHFMPCTQTSRSPFSGLTVLVLVGCSSGYGAAHRLPSGHATSTSTWRPELRKTVACKPFLTSAT